MTNNNNNSSRSFSLLESIGSSSTTSGDPTSGDDDANWTWYFLSIYLPPIVLIIGTVGNIYSFLIFTKLGRIRKMSLRLLFKSLLNKFISFDRFDLVIQNSISKNCNAAATNNNNQNKNKKSSRMIRFTSAPIGGCAASSTGGCGLTIYLYLALLAIFDLSVLYFGLFVDWISDLTDFNIKTQSQFLCKSFTFIAFISSHCSSFLIVIASSLRFMAVYEPFKASNLANMRMFKLTSLTLLAIFACVNLHLFWNMELKPLENEKILQLLDENLLNSKNGSLNNKNKKKFLNSIQSKLILTTGNSQASPTNSDLINAFLQFNNDTSLLRLECTGHYKPFMKNVWPFIDKLIYCLIPFILISIFNLLIIRNISKAEKVCQLLKLKITYKNNNNTNENSQMMNNNNNKTSDNKVVHNTINRSESYSNMFAMKHFQQQQQQHSKCNSVSAACVAVSSALMANSSSGFDGANLHELQQQRCISQRSNSFNALDLLPEKKMSIYAEREITSKMQHQQQQQLELLDSSVGIKKLSGNMASAYNNRQQRLKEAAAKLNIKNDHHRMANRGNMIKDRKKQLKKYHLVGKHFTVMLLGLSFGFLLLTLPVGVIFLFTEYLRKEIDMMNDLENSNKSMESLINAQKATSLLMYLNHSINFLLYFATGSRFRRQFYRNFFTLKCVCIPRASDAKPCCCCVSIRKMNFSGNNNKNNNNNKIDKQLTNNVNKKIKLNSSLYD